MSSSQIDFLLELVKCIVHKHKFSPFRKQPRNYAQLKLAGIDPVLLTPIKGSDAFSRNKRIPQAVVNDEQSLNSLRKDIKKSCDVEIFLNSRLALLIEFYIKHPQIWKTMKYIKQYNQIRIQVILNLMEWHSKECK